MVKFEFKEDGILKTLQFNIKFITPLLIGGANNHVDENGLSGKALRGCWRFWFRAMVGGMMKAITIEDMISLENRIFGSADNNIGAKFRLNIIKMDKYEPEKFILGFMRNGQEQKKYGFSEGSSYSITILPRETMSEDEINILFSTIWLWGNLGSVGNRERRGFGSPVIGLKSGGDYHITLQNSDKTTIKLPIKDNPFKDSKELKEHLKKGLSSVWSFYEHWVKANKVNTVGKNIDNLPHPTDAPYYILQSLEQVCVGNLSYFDGGDAIRAIHGNSNCRELGGAFDRMASPVFIRIHQTVRNSLVEYLPIFTWCKQRNVPNDNNCARNYLTNISNGQTKVFTENLMGQKL